MAAVCQKCAVRICPILVTLERFIGTGREGHGLSSPKGNVIPSRAESPVRNLLFCCRPHEEPALSLPKEPMQLTSASAAARASPAPHLCHRSENGDAEERGRFPQGARAPQFCAQAGRDQAAWPTRRCSCRQTCRRSGESISSSAASRTKR